MQINLETLTAAYKKSAYIPGIIVLNSKGSVIEIWHSTRDLFNARREVKPGCHITYNDEQYTILAVEHLTSHPKNLVLTLDKDFPKENYHVSTRKRLSFNVNGDLQGKQLMLFTTKRQHNALNFVGSIVTSNTGKHFIITSSYFLEKRPKYLVATVEELDFTNLEQTYNLVLPERKEVF